MVNKDCLAYYTPTNDTWRCFFAEYTLPFIKTPLFVSQDLADSWQVRQACVCAAVCVLGAQEEPGGGVLGGGGFRC